MKAIGVSVQGNKSEFNEDACLLLVRQKLFVVADGVGGGPSGHAASRAFVEACTELGGRNALKPEVVLSCFQAANTRVHSLAMESGQQGMASTLVAALVLGNELHVFHAGDSRAYLGQNGRLQRLTNDHSKLVQRDGRAEKALITRAVGIRENISIEHGVFPYTEGDTVLLVSDGISDPLDESRIASIVCDKGLSLFDRARMLCRDAENNGGQDDKTVVIAI